jgi:lysophospholipase L1-like esterase
VLVRGRWGARLGAAVVAVACVLGTASCSPGGASAAGSTSAARPAGTGTYLALGDSVPFGYRDGGDFRHEATLVGYPSLVGEDLGLRVVNATCPGETTASFLDTSAASNGCQRSPTSSTGYRQAYPLHVRYDSADQSQLAFAVRALTSTSDVRLVTVQLGANDAFLCERTTPGGCAAPAEKQALVQQVGTNLTKILSALRGDGGYRGRIVVVTYYAIDYSVPDAAATQGLDAAITLVAQAQGAVVASGFDAFRPAAQAAGGSSVAAGLVGSGDVHPTAKGQQLLAKAVEAVTS